MIFTLVEQREEIVRKARQSFAEGHYREGRALARHADYLQHDAQSGWLIAVGHLLTRSYFLALRTYWQIKKE
jgi:hypothetical protein